MIEIIEDPLVTARKELRYGKVVVERSTASFEYLRAHFSNKSIPIGSLPMRLASPTDACTIDDSEEIASTVAITLRGNCSFVDKAGNLSAAQVAGIIVVNNSSEMFQMAAGYATGAAGAAGTGNGQLEEDTSHIPTHLPVVSSAQHGRCASSECVRLPAAHARSTPPRRAWSRLTEQRPAGHGERVGEQRAVAGNRRHESEGPLFALGLRCGFRRVRSAASG